jgi:hypothetical protein
MEKRYFWQIYHENEKFLKIYREFLENLPQKNIFWKIYHLMGIFPWK